MTREGLIAAMARAMYFEPGTDTDRLWDMTHPEVQRVYRLVATRALAAIEAAGGVVVPREPTDAMCADGADELPTQTCESTDEEAAAEIWRAMLAVSPLAEGRG